MESDRKFIACCVHVCFCSPEFEPRGITRLRHTLLLSCDLDSTNGAASSTCAARYMRLQSAVRSRQPRATHSDR